MASITLLNPKAQIVRTAEAVAINVTAAKGLKQLMSSNLGPKGTTKMLVSPAGEIKITKDGNVLMQEMHFYHPTAEMIGRASTAQDLATGDGTTSTVLLIGELMSLAEKLLAEGLHPRLLTNGIMLAKEQAEKQLKKLCIPVEINRDNLLALAQTSLRTKVDMNLADLLAGICVEAVLSIRRNSEQQQLDLNMIELMVMKQYTTMDTQLVDGLVLDHGGRHSAMPTFLEEAYILTCNVSLELEKTAVSSSFCYKTPEERERYAEEEHRFINLRVDQIIQLKNKLCTGNGRGFVVINQKGIDIPSLEALAGAGILALRRAKRRNMERLMRACGGEALHSFEDLGEHHLGYAGLVYQQELGETKYTFIRKCRNPSSVTIVICAPSVHQAGTIKDAIRDGLHAIQNTISDECVVPGAGALELSAYNELVKFKDSVKGRSQLGVQLFADALLIIPKTLAINSGLDVLDTIVKLKTAVAESDEPVGLNLQTGEPMNPMEQRVFDNYFVKKQILNSCSIIAYNLLLTDEIMQAGMLNLKG